MLCWRRVEQRVDQLEHLGLGRRIGGRVAGDPVAVGAGGGHKRSGVQVAGGLLVGGAEVEGAELDGGDPIRWRSKERARATLRGDIMVERSPQLCAVRALC